MTRDPLEATQHSRVAIFGDRFGRDLGFALRSLRRSPIFALTAIAVIATGVAAITAVFSVANTVLFRPMAVGDPASLVWLTGTHREQGDRRQLSYPEIERLAEARSTFSSVIAYQDVEATLASPEGPRRATALLVSPGYFQTLGVAPALGRAFVAGSDGEGEVVLAWRTWTSRFAADSGVIGRAILVAGRSFTVVGVAPRGFVGLEIESDPELWTTLVNWRVFLPGARVDFLANKEWWWLRAAARLAPGVTREAAAVQVTAMHATMRQGEPGLKGTSIELRAVRGGIDPPDRMEAVSVFGVLLLVPGLLLAIACANVANLMLARAGARQRELGVRAALGAGRGRLIVQLLTEAILIALVGGALGTLLAAVGTPLLLRVMPIPPELVNAVGIDVTVLAVSLLVTTGCALFVGLLPALAVTRGDLAQRLRGSASQAAPRQVLMRRMIRVEVAASFVLLVMSTFFVKSLRTQLRTDPGFDARAIGMVEIHPTLSGYDPARRDALLDDVLARAATLPSVAAISAADYPPMGRRFTYRNAKPLDDGARTPTMVAVTEARAGLPATYGLRMVAGRDMTAEEQRRGDRVTVVSEETARRLWGASNPVGRSISFAGSDSLPYQVVGVVTNVRYASLRGPADAWAILSEQGGRHRDATQLVVRTRGDAAASIAAVQRLVRDLDPNLAIMSMSTMESMLWERTDESRALSTTLALFGSLALLLAAMGLYGVTAYAVAQRRREIGVRLAIGATPGTVVRELVHDGIRLASVGMVAGAILTVMGWLLSRSMLYGIGVIDGLTVFVAAAVQVVTVGLAVWFAARRAARYDPAMVLRLD